MVTRSLPVVVLYWSVIGTDLRVVGRYGNHYCDLDFGHELDIINKRDVRVGTLEMHEQFRTQYDLIFYKCD